MRALSLFLLCAACARGGTAEDCLARDAKAIEDWKASPVALSGRIVDEDGFGVAATVSVQGRPGTADKRGWFRIENLARRNALLTVTAEGFFVELRVADLELPGGAGTADIGTIRVRARRPGRVRLVFGGDAMMTRRFINPDNIEAPPAAPLRRESIAADAAEVLREIAPVLLAADFAVLNLETVVGENCGAPVSTKEHNFLTPPGALDALKAAGADAFTLGNNHSWDFGEAGLRSTLAELQSRGLASCGAGRDETAARRAAVLRAPAGPFHLLSYSGIAGTDVPLLAQGNRGGAAPMDPARIGDDVRALAGAGPVIVALHSGTEYSSKPTARFTAAARAATGAGAALVVGHHPHAPQGLTLEDGVLVARCLGNFVFDQSRYEALPGLLLVADFEDGRVAAARIVPIVSDDYRPLPAAGPLARWTARRVGALSRDVAVYWEAGGIRVDLEAPHRAVTTRQAILADGMPARVAPEDPAAFVVAADAAAPIEAGRDLLRVGGFESGDVDGDVLEGGVWSLPAGARISPAGARTGTSALRLVCAPRAEAATRFRIPVPGKFTVAGWWNAPRGASASVECDFCALPSLDPVSRGVAGKLDSSAPGWKPFTFDVERPKDARFIRLRLAATGPAGEAAEILFDDLAVVEWAPVKGRRAAPNEWDWLRAAGARGATPVTLEIERLGRD